jgi:two-component system NtrC family sensor kinase
MKEPARELQWSKAVWSDEPPAFAPLEVPLMWALIENISTRVAVVSPELRYTYANREALRFMGLPADQVIGRHLSEVLDAGIYQSFLPLFERLFAGESLHLKGWVEYQKQGRRYREQMLVPYAPGSGPVQSVVVCGLDHTELRRGEEQLRASEALKTAIVDHALAALISTDVSGIIVEFNPSAEAMFGRRRADVIGKAVGEIVVPDRFRENHEAGLRRVGAGGPSRLLGQRVEMRAMRIDGSEFPIEMVLSRTDSQGEVFYTASIVDLSERHNAALQIERQRDALRQSEKLSAMGTLLAGVAHELNNPLAIVMGRSGLLEEKCEALPEIALDAKRIREAAERCGRIVRTFLNMARSRPALRSEVSLNELARGTADLLAYSYRTHDVELRIELDPQLPTVSADADQLSQVLLNLMVNAQQALQHVSGERRVTLRTGLDSGTRGGPDMAWLRVSDSGLGISAEVAARIFEPFFTTKAEGMGTGLGLSVSASLVREHGGSLTLEASQPGEGAVFRFALPVALNTQPVAPGPIDDEPRVADTAAVARLLVVDDEPEVVAMLRDMLERAGYDVAVAESGAVALEMIAAANFDAVVSDLRMPDMGGADLWQQIAQREPRLGQRILFVTGDTLSRDTRAFLTGAGCGTLEKPFAKAELLARVAELLQR